MFAKLLAVALAVAALSATTFAAPDPQVLPKATPPVRPAKQSTPFQVGGYRLGIAVDRNGVSYRQLTCAPSTQFSGFTWCEHTRSASGANGTFAIKTSLLHQEDSSAVYINQNIEPAFLSSQTARAELDRLSLRFGEKARIYEMAPKEDMPEAIIGVWGKAVLEALPRETIHRLASGITVKEGILVDFLGNLRRSSQLALPIYRVRGGQGYVWSGSFDKNGRGHLRIFAIDPSTLSLPSKPTTPIANSSPAPDSAPKPKTPIANSSSAPDTANQPDQCEIDVGTGENSKERKDQDLRKCRLQQLTNRVFKATPKFYEYLVRKTEIAGLPEDIPVLRIVFEERVFFDTARWELLAAAKPALDIVVATLRKEPSGTALFVAGHTDARGSDEYNLDLSVKRANSVAEALVKQSVGTVKIWRVGFGKAVPLRPNNSPENMGINRRVEFILASRFDAALHTITKIGKYICADATETLPEFCRDLAVAPQQVELVPVRNSTAPIAPIEIIRIPVQAPEQIEVPLDVPPLIEQGRPLQ